MTLVQNPGIEPDFEYDYGSTFSYAAWVPGTQLTMVNVKWNSDYRDIVKFPNRNALNNYINNRPGKRVIERMSLLKWGQNARINLPINAAMKYNYARASNPTMPVDNDEQRDYYYFVLDYVFVSPEVTELVLQLDVWQTFGFDVTFGNCYVQRGHIGIANQNQFSSYGRDYLTVPEGVDVGGEYRIVHVASEQLIDPSFADGYSVLVCSTSDLSSDPGTPDNPLFRTAKGAIFENMPSGASFYIFDTGAKFRQFMSYYSDKPWMTEGISSVTLIPNISRYHPGSGLPILNPDENTEFTGVPFNAPTPKSNALLTNWRNNEFVERTLGQYGILKKLLTYPYCVIELTSFSGSPIVIKPESWQDADARVREMVAFVPPGQRIVVAPYRYNWDSPSETDAFDNDDQGESINFALVIDDFPQLPVVNNMAIGFLAANKNGLAFQFRSADWSQQKAMRGAQATYDVAGAEIANTARQAGIAGSSATDIAATNAATAMNNSYMNFAGSAVTAGLSKGLPVGGVVAAGGDVFNTQREMNAMLENTQRGNRARGESAISSNTAAGSVRDTNVALQRFAAKGDYENEVAGIQAKIQDAALTQPSTSGQFGGNAFNIINGMFGYSARFKMVSAGVIKTVGNYWLRYGYAIEQYLVPPADLQCMTKFTYWKFSESYISQAFIPESFKQTIRGIFEKGVTVWGNPEDIGTTSLFDNAPKAGISY